MGSLPSCVSLRRNTEEQMHLFDLLRDKRIFASNNDLAAFAAKIFPNIKSNRFDNRPVATLLDELSSIWNPRDQSSGRGLKLRLRSCIYTPGKSVGKKKLCFQMGSDHQRN